MTKIHAERKCKYRPGPRIGTCKTNGRGKLISEGAPTPPASPQYRRGCAKRMAIPLASRARKLIVVIQCVTRTVKEWCEESDAITSRTSTARTCADSAIVNSSGDRSTCGDIGQCLVELTASYDSAGVRSSQEGNGSDQTACDGDLSRVFN
jgi:hypothetical protein